MVTNKPYFPAIADHNHAVALVQGDQAVTYGQFSQQINRLASGLLAGGDDLRETRIAILMPACIEYAVTMHGIWRAGGLAVPINAAATADEITYFLSAAQVQTLVTTADTASDELLRICKALDVHLVTATMLCADEPTQLPDVDEARRALMLFTSGTTNKPKGVVHTHRSIRSQVTSLIDAWEWTSDDVIPLFLPVHHIHGIINILSCALWVGARVHLFSKFDLPVIAKQVAAKDYTVFMAVPTIYIKFIQYFQTLGQTELAQLCEGFKSMRLNVSGSAACPVKLFNEWRDHTGQVLLERYGMTEIGMGISNPYRGERRAGYVGQALPGVEVQLFDENDKAINKEDIPGEIRIRGNNLFLEYWNNHQATLEAFKNGWFCSGDMALVEDGYYRIMGRTSIDIIKSGGYKLSALEIEGVLLNHDAIAEVAVIAVEDATWGEAVAAVVGLKADAQLSHEELKSWCQGKMSAYKIPKLLKTVDALPRNAMGKVTKPELQKLF